MSYQPKRIEDKWQSYWRENALYQVKEDRSKPKYYVLDMFPYPSGAGLHVGHPLGYIASDIYARFKRQQGFNVLHPMGFDAFGLPAEQYAIQTGQHPAVTTEENAAVYRKQLDNIGFSFDWSREVRTCDPGYYKWTQWAFIQLFEHWYDIEENKAKPISKLRQKLAESGTQGLDAVAGEDREISAADWQKASQAEQESILQNYRLAYLGETMVNWCPALGTVLANEEVSEGLSVRGGHPGEQREMQQWSLRITAYADRLLSGLDSLDWPESVKEMQRNWIGKSTGTQMKWEIIDHQESIDIYTTRPDTIFGATFMVLAPEHPLVKTIVSKEQSESVAAFLDETAKRSERDRMANTKEIRGVFTGAYCKHPYTDKETPIWIADYVLMGYGTGAIMAVPAHDSRDYAFAKHFSIPIIQVIEGDMSEGALETKTGTVINSDFLNGLSVPDAIKKSVEDLVDRDLGNAKINFRLRDASFSRQRYWGEPFPVYYQDQIPKPLDIEELPLKLPSVDAYLPTEDGDPPLGTADNWQTKDGHPYELSTMPGFAGSSAYFLRYMDPHNDQALASSDAINYWQQVDLYVGGKEHATGHLLYSRFWNMFLYDIGVAVKEEPFKKLINQGMIQGQSHFAYRVKGTQKFVSHGLKDQHDTQALHVNIGLVKNRQLDTEGFKSWRPEFAEATFDLEDGKYICGQATEKMSKSYYNVVNPDDVIAEYGADTFRLYEMFLGPVEQSKGWDTQGIEGVHRFIKRTWSLFVNDEDQLITVDETPSQEELKSLHKMLKKVKTDIEGFSFNTAVAAFMICTNELIKLKSHKTQILSPYAAALASFAPHMAEELWQRLGNKDSVLDAKFPDYDESYLVENTFACPVSVNGKMKFTLEVPKNLSKEDMESLVLSHEKVKKLIGDKSLRKAVIVPNKIVNLVL